MIKDLKLIDHNRFHGIFVLVLASLLAAYVSSGCKKDVNEESVPTAKFIKGPYLIYPDDNTQMKVLWYTNRSPVNTRLAWGRTESCSDSNIAVTEESYSSSVMHGFKYVITGLTPGHKDLL